MKKKKTIRQIVREEVAIAIQEVITELKQPTQQVSKPKSKVKKKQYTNNTLLNEVMNETAQSEEWKSMGGGTYDSSKMNEVLGKSYGDMMNGNNEINSDAMVASMGVNPKAVDDSVKNIFTKDYRSLMKKVDEKKKQKLGM